MPLCSDTSLLSTNDNIRVIAPGYGISSEELKQIKEYAQSLPYNIIIPNDIVDHNYQGFSANSDNVRKKQLYQALTDEKCKIIWTLRGGYGSTLLIDIAKDIAHTSHTKFPKWLIGFSDITALHTSFIKHLKWPTIHGATLRQMLYNSDKINPLSQTILLDFYRDAKIPFL